MRRGKSKGEGGREREERERLNCILYINHLRHNIKEYFTVQMKYATDF